MGEKIDRQHIFKEYFESGTGYDFAKSQALCGTLQHSPLRSLCWRVFLGLLPGNDTSSWVKLLEAQRKEYSELVKHYSVDPYQAEKEGDLAIFNPLSQDEDSPWQTFFHNKELKEVILQDIHRTYQEKEFFQLQKSKDQMLQILFIYVKENSTSNIGYRQGMHELLAPVLYLLHNQSIPVDQLDGHISSVINSEEYVEHDAFIIFRKMMSICEKWYLTSDPSRSETVVDPLSVKTSLTSSSNGDLNSSSPIIVKCKYIQGKLLRDIDPTLASYLDDMSIEPQIYILRWVRLLFGREFHLDDVLVVWDAIFAFGGDFDLIDHLCLAMLQYIRGQLLSSDNNGCLKRLFNYPPVEDVTLIILKALSYADPKLKIKSKKLTPPVKPLPPPPEKESTPSIAIRNFVDTLLDDPQARLAEKFKKSQETRVHMSSRLERIVYILQSSVLSPDEVSKDDLIGVIAELKQVKDILNGSIEDSSMHPNALFHQFK